MKPFRAETIATSHAPYTSIQTIPHRHTLLRSAQSYTKEPVQTYPRPPKLMIYYTQSIAQSCKICHQRQVNFM